MIRLLVSLSAGIAVYLVLRRTWRVFRDLDLRLYPNFVYANVKAEELGIPVFTYHSIASRGTPDSVTLAEFDHHMRYLAENGYYTLSADELRDHLVHGSSVPSKSVMITFDDGRATLWTVAYPILRKHGLKAVSFVVPGTMSETGVRPSLSDCGTEKATLVASLLNPDQGDTPTITWDEARVMHASGLVDLQSHTLDHALIYCASEIVDFVNPAFRFGYNNYRVPVIRYHGVDRVHFRPPLGTPLYRSRPRMSSAKRFFDDEGLRYA
jgi:peptidoglycan/xylan/chitin deacetylase (PgdA/CDA1 family)